MSILIKPIITEKATRLSELENSFTFEVAKTANKIQIKEAVESTYGVSVDQIRTINVRPDRRTRYTKTGIVTGKTNAMKKAVVKVADGDTIDLYSNL